MLQLVCDVVKYTDKEEYLRPVIRIGLDGLHSLVLTFCFDVSDKLKRQNMPRIPLPSSRTL